MASHLTHRNPSGERGDEAALLLHHKPERANIATKADGAASMLLSYEDIPAWQQDNPYIRNGYRPVSRSSVKSVSSWFYVHNETMNIYTHLIPALVLTIIGSVLFYIFLQRYPLAAAADLAVFAIMLLSAITCFTLSAGYHTLENHSEHVCNLSLRCDYVGILILTLGDFVSGIRMGFFCEPTLRIIYWTMILVLGALTGLLLLNSHFQGRQYRSLRLGAFIATGLSAIAPIIHGTIYFGFVQLVKQSGLMYYLIEGLIILAGAFFYGTRIPESIAPGKFDIWGGSHQIFHILVVIATAVHFVGLYKAYEYNYAYRTCGLV